QGDLPPILPCEPALWWAAFVSAGCALLCGSADRLVWIGTIPACDPRGVPLRSPQAWRVSVIRTWKIAGQDCPPIIRGILANYLSLVVSLLAMLILTPVLLRSLGSAAYGFWAVLGSLATYLVLCDFGMNTAVAKYTAEYRTTGQLERLSATVSTILAMVIVSGVVM